MPLAAYMMSLGLVMTGTPHWTSVVVCWCLCQVALGAYRGGESPDPWESLCPAWLWQPAVGPGNSLTQPPVRPVRERRQWTSRGGRGEIWATITTDQKERGAKWKFLPGNSQRSGRRYSLRRVGNVCIYSLSRGIGIILLCFTFAPIVIKWKSWRCIMDWNVQMEEVANPWIQGTDK